ncbi:MAG: virulence RhuM family protein [Bacteroidales bacterium]|nr:virulence RhuM family protein [Bacteroidales bacterium]
MMLLSMMYGNSHQLIRHGTAPLRCDPLNIYQSGELDYIDTYSILEYMGNEGKQMYQARYYNLDMILSIGYRVNSRNAIAFRRWASTILKEYLLKGYSLNQRLKNMEDRFDRRMSEYERRLYENEHKIDFFVRTSLPPVEGIFYDGQIFDAYVSVTKNIHDRFLIVDEDVYHIGASLKDLGKKLFAFSKINVTPSVLIQ